MLWSWADAVPGRAVRSRDVPGRAVRSRDVPVALRGSIVRPHDAASTGLAWKVALVFLAPL
ncbi:hypothetical protein BIV24_11735 [Streptomyces colonosanans]|uniref:Uncharacterized protein n=1 Tax=Streptomyces colonosanans TaxID=1428652 RepID=A0A1S2PIR0_9ACTN|nr:hypothetical protein BIV24_11735 [Streptomyces colonosanans]